MAKVAIGIDILFVPDPLKDGVVALGDVYIGEPDTDPEIEVNRKVVTIIQENGTEVVIQPAGQPLNTGSGGVLLYNGSAVTVLVEGEYSLKVNDNLGAQVYYVPSQNAEASISLSGGKIINGSFEAITAGEPDNWLNEPSGTGTIASDTTEQGNGLASLKFTSIDALGAGQSTSDAFDVSSGEGVDVNYMLKATGGLTRNTIEMIWLDSVGGIVSTVVVADHNGVDESPLAWAGYGVRTALAPATAVQGQIRLLGMNAGGGAMTGSSWFDDIRVNDNAVNLGNAVTEDSTNNLSNKTIVEGQYAGTQTGFVGDVDGNASSADVIAGQGALATLDEVGADQITDGSVGADEVADDSIRFSNELSKVNSNYDFTMTNVNPSVVVPAGNYLGVVSKDNGATMDGIFYIEFLIDGVWKINRQYSVVDGLFTEFVEPLISNGVAVRLRFTYQSGNATPNPVARFKKIYA